MEPKAGGALADVKFDADRASVLRLIRVDRETDRLLSRYDISVETRDCGMGDGAFDEQGEQDENGYDTTEHADPPVDGLCRGYRQDWRAGIRGFARERAPRTGSGRDSCQTLAQKKGKAETPPLNPLEEPGLPPTLGPC